MVILADMVLVVLLDASWRVMSVNFEGTKKMRSYLRNFYSSRVDPKG